MNFKKLLADYINKQINEKELYNLLNTYYYELLSEYKFRELEYLKLYPFISQLLDEDLYQESTLKDEIKRINEILDGVRDYSHVLYMKLEEKDSIRDLCTIWNDYKINKKISLYDMEKIEKRLLEDETSFKRISDIYISKLVALLNGLPMIQGEEIIFNLLYISNTETIDISDDIERIISILQGKKMANVFIRYEKGIVNYSCL